MMSRLVLLLLPLFCTLDLTSAAGDDGATTKPPPLNVACPGDWQVSQTRFLIESKVYSYIYTRT